jgi:hypothetical protein
MEQISGDYDLGRSVPSLIYDVDNASVQDIISHPQQYKKHGMYFGIGCLRCGKYFIHYLRE